MTFMLQAFLHINKGSSLFFSVAITNIHRNSINCTESLKKKSLFIHRRVGNIRQSVHLPLSTPRRRRQKKKSFFFNEFQWLSFLWHKTFLFSRCRGLESIFFCYFTSTKTPIRWQQSTICMHSGKFFSSYSHRKFFTLSIRRGSRSSNIDVYCWQ